jgi:CDGSH-type Zn-finger protein/uncharacterized Fe-S cluster protein YjdI
MTYTGRDQDRVYTGENADVTYSLRRCIHAKECVTRLSTVFNLDQRPWIQVGATDGDVLADTVERCPSGALHHIRKDGGAAEATPVENRITLWPNGPIQIYGDLHIVAAGVDVENETRATLCRCGASQNKPFCDNSHQKIDFKVVEAATPDTLPVSIIEGGTLNIDALPDGPLQVTGSVRIVDVTGAELFAGDSVRLCRCGGSAKKPFCDGTHLHNGFQAE